MIIREAVLKDYESVKKINQEVHQLHVKNLPTIFNETSDILPESYFTQLLESDLSSVMIIEENVDVVAYLIIRTIETPNIAILKKRKYVFIDDLGVMEAYRGQGLGKKLINYALEFCKKIEASSLELSVWDFNESAIAFYEQLGMKTKSRRMGIDLTD